jgi:protoheme IX farnesyltransferase
MSMTSTAIPIQQRSVTWWVRCADYVELTKPRISVLVLVTVGVAGIVARWGQPDVWPLLHAIFGTALVAASASSLNQWLERKADAMMARTADRPLPSGRLSGGEVLTFGVISLLIGLFYLLVTVGWTTAGIGALTWAMYVLVYTPMKQQTAWNTLIGAIAGALPILIGWTAVGGHLGIRMSALFAVVFLWQFPHFMAIAWLYRDEYAAAGIQMTTVVDQSGLRAGVQAVFGALALLPVTLVLVMFTPHSGFLAVFGLAMGAAQLACAGVFLVRRDRPSAKGLLRASLIYLPALLLTLAVAPLA